MESKAMQSAARSIFWLIVGCGLLLFMGGKWNIVAATWLGSIFFLRYFRTVRNLWLGLLLALPLIGTMSHVFFIGLAEQVAPTFKVLIAASYTLYIVLPCLADRILYPRVGNRLLSTLVYPVSLIVVQFLLSYVEDLGTVLHWTGSLFASKPLIQLVAITGVWGPSFLVGWFASIVNELWAEHFDLHQVKWPAAVFSALLVAASLWGGVRMLFFAPSPGTVRVGSVIVNLPQDNLFWTYLDLPPAEQAAHKAQYRAWSHQVQDDLFAASERLIPSGIKILAWGSGNAIVFAEDEAALTRRMQDFARQHQVYFFPTLLVAGDYSGPDRTKALAIRPDGEIAYVHYKGRNPNAGYYEGNAIEYVDTPYGRIASPICFEMEFHRYIRQIGQAGVDILLVPGDEPARDVAIIHTEMSMLRGIENGASVLRTTLEGLTMGADYQGRVLSQVNFYLTPGPKVLITELPMKGTRTFYARYGDWFAYLCVIIMVGLAGTAAWLSVWVARPCTWK